MKGSKFDFCSIFVSTKGRRKECWSNNNRNTEIKIVDSLLKNYQMFWPFFNKLPHPHKHQLYNFSPNSQKPHWDCGGFISQIFSLFLFFLLSSNEVVSTSKKLFFLPPKTNENFLFFWMIFPSRNFLYIFFIFHSEIFVYNKFFLCALPRNKRRRNIFQTKEDYTMKKTTTPYPCIPCCNCCLSSSYMPPITSSASKKLCNIIQNLNIFWLLLLLPLLLVVCYCAATEK